MKARLGALALIILSFAWFGGPSAQAADNDTPDIGQRMDRLDAQLRYAEDVQAIKRLQRTYGYYLDKGMWTDLAEFFTDDAVANYPAGVYIGKESIREHLYLNVGAVKMGEVGLGDNRLYNHMNIQPVVHVDAGGKTAKGRWRAFAFFGSLGGGAIWAEGVYEIGYAKVDGVWKIKTLDYYSGFGAPYATGWVGRDPKAPPPEPRSRMRNLPHAADATKPDQCPGFPDAACIEPFHYDNPGTSKDGHVWQVSEADIKAAAGKADKKRAGDLLQRARLLKAETDIENLQRVYGYYYDRAMWDQMADLFADDATIEFAQRGQYKGQDHVRRFLHSLGHDGLVNGWLNVHTQLQTVVTVAADGKTARARTRQLSQTGHVGQDDGQWEEGVYENRYVNDNGIWKFQSVHYYPTVITPYDKGWGKEALPAPGIDKALPPDSGPTEVYEIFPKAQIPAYHYRNPVTGKVATYPEGRPGRPSDKAIKANLMPQTKLKPAKVKDVAAAVTEAERDVQRYKDYNEIENLESAYGYYLDKDLWNNLADLFSTDGTMELAQRGIYKGQDHVRQFLLTVFGRGKEGPVKNRLGNHIQVQPVITIAADGQSANIRTRMVQQMAFGPRASHGGAIYENAAVKEDGVWKLSTLHAYNTFSAPYDGGWTSVSGKAYVPGPSKDYPPDAPPTFTFDMFPNVYYIPFHYANPVTGKVFVPVSEKGQGSDQAKYEAVPGIPPEMAKELREIGPRIEGQKTTAMYAALQPSEPYKGVKVSRDLSYGPHERHVLDVFSSLDAGSGKPVVVFVHGGGFSRGAKHTPGSPFYDNVGLWAEHEGMVGVTINYRLAPEFKYPSGVEDLTRVVAWLKAHIADYGGDPNKNFLWGHSAGCAHVADYVAAMERQGKDAGIAGAILSSGFYTFGDTVSIWKDYYGDDVSKYPDMASLPWLLKTDVPLFVNDAELDPPTFRPDTVALVQGRKQEGRPVPYVHLIGHSHLSELYAVGTDDQSLSAPVKSFIDSIAGGR
jgi:triacylglycerol lipase